MTSVRRAADRRYPALVEPQMTTVWPRVRLGDVLRFTPRPVTVESSRTYREIGIRSHGRGIFHKPPVTGLDIGNKKVFYIEPDDFVLNIVFAWEGAVANHLQRGDGYDRLTPIPDLSP